MIRFGVEFSSSRTVEISKEFVIYGIYVTLCAVRRVHACDTRNVHSHIYLLRSLKRERALSIHVNIYNACIAFPFSFPRYPRENAMQLWFSQCTISYRLRKSTPRYFYSNACHFVICCPGFANACFHCSPYVPPTSGPITK